MNANEPVAVYTTNDLYEAEIIKNSLEAEGIPCEVDGTNQGGFVEMFDVRIVVRAADVERARRVLAEHEQTPPLEELPPESPEEPLPGA